MEQQNTTSGQMPTTRGLDASVSFIAGAVLLVIAIAVGGFYILNSGNMGTAGMEINTQGSQMVLGSPEEITATNKETVAATAALSTQGNSDELGAIESDLDATDLSSLEDINQI